MEAKIEFGGGWVVMSLRDWEQYTAENKMVREGLEEKCRKLEAAGKAVPMETVRETVPKKLVEHVVRAHKRMCEILDMWDLSEPLQKELGEVVTEVSNAVIAAREGEK